VAAGAFGFLILIQVFDGPGAAVSTLKRPILPFGWPTKKSRDGGAKWRSAPSGITGTRLGWRPLSFFIMH
jgi:hypothetical protein